MVGLPPKFRSAVRKLPELEGKPISVRFLPDLTAFRGELRSGGRAGVAVHGGSFIHKRIIVLETALLGAPNELSRILVHEIFHFVWLCLGNSRRRSFENVVALEFRMRSRGELGWSAESRKACLKPEDLTGRTRRWREYLSESFCDSAARIFSTCERHSEYTLAPSFQRRREAWFHENLPAVLHT